MSKFSSSKSPTAAVTQADKEPRADAVLQTGPAGPERCHGNTGAGPLGTRHAPAEPRRAGAGSGPGRSPGIQDDSATRQLTSRQR